MFPSGFLAERLPQGLERQAGEKPPPREEGFWDVMGNVFPWQLHLRREIRQGRLSWWLPWAGGGEPFLANDSPGALWPGNWLSALFPASWQLTVMALLRLVIASSGMIFLLRRLGLAPPAQATGAVAYSFGWMMLYGIAWPHANAASVLPWIFLALEGVLATPGARNAAFLALAVGASFLAGHAQTTSQGLFIAGIYSLVRVPLASPDSRRGTIHALFWALAGVALGSFLAAVQLLPVSELIPRSYAWATRGNEFHLPRILALQHLAPTAFGALWWRDSAGKLAIGGPSFFDWPSMCGYVGVATLSLVVAAFRPMRGRWVVAMSVIALVCFSIAYGLGTGWLFFRIPVVSKTPVFRFLLPMSLALACLAAAGVDALMADETGRLRRRVLIAAAVLAVTSGVIVVMVEAPFTPLIRGWRAIGACAALIGALALQKRRTQRAWLIPAICAAELLLVLGGANPWAERKDVYPRSKLGPLLADAPGAFAAFGGTMTPEVATAYRIRDLRGRPPLLVARWRRFFDRLDADTRDGGNAITLLTPDPDWYRIAGIDRYLLPALLSPNAGWVKSGTEVAGRPDVLRGSVITQGLRCEIGSAREILLMIGRLSALRVRADGEDVRIAETARAGKDRMFVRFSRAVPCTSRIELVVEGGPAEMPAWSARNSDDALVDGQPSGKALGAIVSAHPLPGDPVWMGSLVLLDDPDARPLVWAAERVVGAADAAEAEAVLVAKASDARRWAVIEGAAASDPGPLQANESVRGAFTTPQRIEGTVTSLQDRWLIFHQSWDPGWSFRLDRGRAEPLLPANLVYQAAHVPSGTHRFVLEYRPPRLGLGLACSMAALALVGGIFAVPAWRRRRAAHR